MTAPSDSEVAGASADAALSFSLLNKDKKEKEKKDKHNAYDEGGEEPKASTALANETARARKAAPEPVSKKDTEDLHRPQDLASSQDQEVSHVVPQTGHMAPPHGLRPGRRHMGQAEQRRPGLERVAGYVDRALVGFAGRPVRPVEGLPRGLVGHAPGRAASGACGGSGAASATVVAAGAARCVGTLAVAPVAAAPRTLELAAEVVVQASPAVACTALVLWSAEVNPGSSIRRTAPVADPGPTTPPPSDPPEQDQPRIGESEREAHWRGFRDAIVAYGRSVRGRDLTAEQYTPIYTEVRRYSVSVIRRALRLNLEQESANIDAGKTSVRYSAANIRKFCRHVEAQDEALRVAERIKARKPSEKKLEAGKQNGSIYLAWLMGDHKQPMPEPIISGDDEEEDA